jgi:rfaE bifunctional protein kinase chain/domain
MNLDRLAALLEACRSRRLLVVGDLMLDEFVWGRVSRISPEAPVPVVEVLREESYPGGAANVARNLRPFCDRVHVLGMLGDDAPGRRVRELLSENGILPDGLLLEQGWSTIRKTRIIARQQQVVRVDRECVPDPSPGREERVQAHLTELLAGVDAVILEDYGKGFLNQKLVGFLLARAAELGIPVTADPNPRNPLDWSGATAVKPNRSEALAAAGLSDSGHPGDPTDDPVLAEAGRRLLERWAIPLLLVTLGEDGMLLFRKGLPTYHSPTKAREVFDVSGAGDTAIALFTLALSAGGTPEEAAEIANHASGVVVGKLGTATLTREELIRSFESHA